MHLTFEQGRIIARPVAERTHSIRVGLRKSASPLTAFVALSAGVDAACLRAAGFDTRALLEWRPNEKRDLAGPNPRDFTETGCMTAIANSPFAMVFNEDIRTLDHRRLEQTLANEAPFGCLHVSIQCDDFTNLKAASLKTKHLEDLDTTRDLVYDVLKLIENPGVRPACVVIENVPGFKDAAEGQLLMTKLRRWGYDVHAQVLDARDFGGRTSRQRLYIVASVFPGFTMPTPTGRTREPGALWAEIVADEIDQCREVTHTTSVQGGFATGRIRLLRPDGLHAPTVTKSQSRGTKDALYLATDDGRILALTERMLRRLNGIPDTFRLDTTSSELAVEQIGQSIDWDMHHAVASATRDHLLANWQRLDVGAMQRGARPNASGQTTAPTTVRRLVESAVRTASTTAPAATPQATLWD